MKKIVAVVLPVAEAGSRVGEHEESVERSGANGEELLPNVEGAVRLEVNVTDRAAREIVASIVNSGTVDPPTLTLDDLLQKELEEAGPDACDLYDRIVSRVEHRLLSYVYSECDRIKTKAADRLGINRNTLHKKLREHRLDDSEE